ncbi:hypothetical protein SS50377_21610 [Spironucleus salmonicida]|uniref:Uncharacterized protein n=1 Tax=Spironucleus salmonicida TaxID=348837 RepID=V6LNS1_9EUKA|nr:hypothetical protein SS50377_21610 [Spironucleus salmonicida]|eukprot:EST45366.1 Hypothetical protein SS50377_14696 [Spironucleus salmonicida]
MVILHPCRYLACFVILCQSQQEIAAFSNFGIRVLEPVLLMSCLDSLSKLLENCAISYQQGCAQSQIQAQQGLRSCKFQILFGRVKKTQLARYRRRMLLKWNNRIWTFQNSQESCQGAGRMEVGLHSM